MAPLREIDATQAHKLGDHREARVALTGSTLPRYSHFREWLERSWPVLESLDKRRAEASHERESRLDAEEIALTFQAYLLLFKEAQLDTIHVWKHFRAWSDTLRSYIESWNERYAELPAAGDHLANVLARCRQLLGEMNATGRRPSERFYVAPGVLEGAWTRLFTKVPYLDGYAYFESTCTDDMVDHWWGPCLTATSHAIEVVQLLKSIAEIDVELDVPRIVEFIRQHRFGSEYRPALTSEPSLLGTRSAIVAFKSVLNVPCRARLGSERAQVLMGGGSAVGDVAKTALDQMDRILAFDRSENVAPRRMVDLHHALYIVWQVDDDFAKTIEASKQRIRFFLERCFSRGELQVTKKSEGFEEHVEFPCFSLSPDVNASCLTACSIAGRIIRTHFSGDHSLLRMVDEVQPFVRSCFGDGGGFACLPGEEPDMVHTHMGVIMNRDRDWSFERGAGSSIDDYEGRLEFFVARCAKSGGYALMPEWKACAFGTRLALQSFEDRKLQIPDPTGIRNFVWSLWDPKLGGFAGYPIGVL